MADRDVGNDYIEGNVGDDGKVVGVGKEFTQSSASGNHTSIYLPGDDRERERRRRRTRAADDDGIDLWVIELSDKFEDLTKAVVELRLAMVRLDDRIKELEKAENQRALKDWHVTAIMIALLALGASIFYLLWILANGNVNQSRVLDGADISNVVGWIFTALNHINPLLLLRDHRRVVLVRGVLAFQQAAVLALLSIAAGSAPLIDIDLLRPWIVLTRALMVPVLLAAVIFQFNTMRGK